MSSTFSTLSAATTAQELSDGFVAIAIAAGRLILEIYDTDFDVETKSDKSPVTEADQRAETLILAGLQKLCPTVPVVAEEEAAAGNIPEVSDRFILVDPLDGTREFVNKNGEFTVNIALVEQGVPTVGVVYAPAKGRLFWTAGPGQAFEASLDGRTDTTYADPMPISVNQQDHPDGLVVVASRSHRDHKTDELLNHYKVRDMKAAGSSLKFCLVATGEADLYPRHGRTMEWDTAAGQAVLLGAGGVVNDLHGKPLLYGKNEFENPFFIAANKAL